MPSLRKALALSFASKYSSLAIHTVAVVVLARLLTPAEIGVYSVGAAVVALAHVLRDFGVGNYLIQEKELTRDRIRTAFGVALVIAWLMAAVVFALSGPAADFYDEPGLGEVLRVLSLTFLVIPFGSPVLALLQRDMAFGRLYVIEVAGALAHVTTGITLAALGYGFMSLAWASLAAAVMTAAIAVLNRPKIARLLPSFREWRRVASFGGYSSAAGIVTQIGMNANDLILGRMLGFAAVGYYSRAQGLIALFNRNLMSAVTAVALPAFALQHREGQFLREPYLRGTSFVTVFAWPFFGFLGLMAYPIVQILFGSQWDASVPLVQILCVAASIYASHSLNGNLLFAMGEVRKVLKKELIIQPVRIGLVIISALHSLEAVAGSLIIVHSLSFAVSYYYAARLTGLRMRDIIMCVQKSLKVTMLALAIPICVIITVGIQPSNVVMPFALAVVGAGIGWFLGVFFFNHPIQDEIRTLGKKSQQVLSVQWLRLRP